MRGEPRGFHRRTHHDGGQHEGHDEEKAKPSHTTNVLSRPNTKAQEEYSIATVPVRGKRGEGKEEKGE